MRTIQNVDDRRVESAVQRGLTLIEDFMGMNRNDIASRVDSLTTPDLIDLMLFATEAAVRNLPEESEACDRAVVLHMAARHFIYEPSAFDDVDKISERLPTLRAATAQYVDAIVNAPEDERAALALRYLGFSEDTVSQVMEAHDRGDPDGIRAALSGDPAGKSMRVSKPTASMEDWAKYAAGYGRRHFVDPTQEEDFIPLPDGEEAMLPPESIDRRRESLGAAVLYPYLRRVAQYHTKAVRSPAQAAAFGLCHLHNRLQYSERCYHRRNAGHPGHARPAVG